MPGESNISHLQSNREVLKNSPSSDSPEAGQEIAYALLNDRRKFLNFIRVWVQDPADAEDILQKASLKIVSRAASLRDATRAEAWIYRIFRNEIADHFRRLAVRSRRTAALPEEITAQQPTRVRTDPPRVCSCAGEELANLRPNYAEALRAMEMGDQTITTYAVRKRVSVNSATVLLHRARKALRGRLQARCGTCAGSGCFDCGCAPSGLSNHLR